MNGRFCIQLFDSILPLTRNPSTSTSFTNMCASPSVFSYQNSNKRRANVHRQGVPEKRARVQNRGRVSRSVSAVTDNTEAFVDNEALCTFPGVLPFLYLNSAIITSYPHNPTLWARTRHGNDVLASAALFDQVKNQRQSPSEYVLRRLTKQLLCVNDGVTTNRNDVLELAYKNNETLRDYCKIHGILDEGKAPPAEALAVFSKHRVLHEPHNEDEVPSESSDSEQVEEKCKDVSHHH